MLLLHTMNLLPAWIALPVLVFLYDPLVRLFPGVDKDNYVRRIVGAANRYFYQKFIATPFHERILFLPYCLRARNCPTLIDQENGLQCLPDCGLDCELQRTRQIALDLGYQAVFIIVSGRLHKNEVALRSRDFLLRQIEIYRPRAVIGCLCARDLRQKYLNLKNISPNGTLGRHGHAVIPQVVLLNDCNCRQSAVDWVLLERLIRAPG